MTVRFVFCLHNHQPVGNFGFVLEAAYRDAYEPLLGVLERHPSRRVVLHYTGTLWRWFEEHRPQFLERLAVLAAAGQVEFLGGGFYEPILAVIPEHDRQGQLRRLSSHLAARFGAEPTGMWLAERVWEPQMPSTIAGAGLGYVVVDDYHLRAAGVPDEEMIEPFLTGDGEATVAVVGGSERLRYLMPYEDPQKTIAYLRGIHESHPDRDCLVAMADDGEKFGVWPGTHKRVFVEGWLESFFQALEAERSWLQPSTFAEALRHVPARRQAYLPTVSYMEMSEWTLEPGPAARYETVRQAMEKIEGAGYVKHLLRGGYWRGFLAKYPESRFLLGRVWLVSGAIEQAARRTGLGAAGMAVVAEAREELWQAQCNDPYWHGVFGGLYLPFLRAAAWEHLLRAEAAVERLGWGGNPFLAVELRDLDGDGAGEILLRNPHLSVTLDPSSGSCLEFGHKPAAINLAATLTRREESYHRRLAAVEPPAEPDGQAKSIHDTAGMREGGAVPTVILDSYPRRLLTDLWWEENYTLEEWLAGVSPFPGVGGDRYDDWRWTARPGGAGVELTASAGKSAGWRKSFDLDRHGAVLGVSLECAGQAPRVLAQELHFTPTSIRECRLELLAPGGERREVPVAAADHGQVLGVRIVDSYRRLALDVAVAGGARLWLAPLSTVSNSESGYEEILQQLALLLWREDPGPLHVELRVTFPQDAP